MINLLPEQEKISLLREYRLRVIVVGLALFAAAIAIAIVLLIPSYLLSYYRQQSSRDQIAGANQSAVSEHKELVAQVAALNQVVGVLAVPSTDTPPLTLIDLILKNKGPNNTINDISYDSANKTIEVRGISDSRDDLVAFTDGLKTEPLISAVNLPISSLAQDRNVSFDITLTIKKK